MNYCKKKLPDSAWEGSPSPDPIPRWALRASFWGLRPRILVGGDFFVSPNCSSWVWHRAYEKISAT